MIDIWDGLDVSRTCHVLGLIKPRFWHLTIWHSTLLFTFQGIMDISTAVFTHRSFTIMRSDQGGTQDSPMNGPVVLKVSNAGYLVRRGGGGTYVRDYHLRVPQALNQFSHIDSKCSIRTCARLIVPSKG